MSGMGGPDGSMIGQSPQQQQLLPPQQQQQQPIKQQPGNSTMEAQYMQQQSQIFVFSTNLANKAAESVHQGQFQTIIAFHCSQPGTKKILEVNKIPEWMMSTKTFVA
jgi:collagen type V/XI/XXIV/XXVII alpha